MTLKRYVLLAILFCMGCLCLPNLAPVPIPGQTEPTPLPPTSTPTTISPPEPRPASPDRSEFRPGLIEAQQSLLTVLPRLTLYNLSFSIGEDLQHLSGVEEILYVNTEAVTLDSVWLGLFPELLGGEIDIQAVSVSGSPVTAERSDGMLRVPLVLQTGQAVLLRIEFNVTVPSGGSGYYYGIFGYNNGVLSLAHAYPTVLVYDERGWNNHAPDLDGDPLFSDASFYLVTIEAPADLVIVASGVEIERGGADGRQIVRYACGPARDFYLAASPDFGVIQGRLGEVAVNSYYLPGGEQGAEQALEAGLQSIAIFSARYGNYPYTEFDIVPIATAAGGVEYPGLTTVNLNYYHSHQPLLEQIIAHEVGHQWFYNLVGNPTQSEPYLDEALVQYITCQYYADRYGESAWQACMNDLASNWSFAERAEMPIGLSVAEYSSTEYIAIIYGKGAFFYQALRERMGDPAWDAFLRDYVDAYTWNIAYTRDFKTLAETHCGCDLTDLFTEWVYP